MNIANDLQIALSTAAAAVELEATKGFRPLISSGRPNDAVRWALSGATCPAGGGAVHANGCFTAPRFLPSPATATLTAQSIADPSKSASAAITIISNFTLQLSAPASVPVGTSAGIVATLTPIPRVKSDGGTRIDMSRVQRSHLRIPYCGNRAVGRKRKQRN